MNFCQIGTLVFCNPVYIPNPLNLLQWEKTLSPFLEANQGLITAFGLLIAIVGVPTLLDHLQSKRKKPRIEFSLEYFPEVRSSKKNPETSIWLRIRNVGEADFNGDIIWNENKIANEKAVWTKDFRENGPFFISEQKIDLKNLSLPINSSSLKKIGCVLGRPSLIAADLLKSLLPNRDPRRFDQPFYDFALSFKAVAEGNQFGYDEFPVATVIGKSIESWKEKDLLTKESDLLNEENAYLDRIWKSSYDIQADYLLYLSTYMSRAKIQEIIEKIQSIESIQDLAISDNFSYLIARGLNRKSKNFDNEIYRWLAYREGSIDQMLSRWQYNPNSSVNETFTFLKEKDTLRVRLPGGTLCNIQGSEDGPTGGYWANSWNTNDESKQDYISADYTLSLKYGSPPKEDALILANLLREPISDEQIMDYLGPILFEPNLERIDFRRKLQRYIEI